MGFVVRVGWGCCYCDWQSWFLNRIEEVAHHFHFFLFHCYFFSLTSFLVKKFIFCYMRGQLVHQFILLGLICIFTIFLVCSYNKVQFFSHYCYQAPNFTFHLLLFPLELTGLSHCDLLFITGSSSLIQVIGFSMLIMRFFVVIEISNYNWEFDY